MVNRGVSELEAGLSHRCLIKFKTDFKKVLRNEHKYIALDKLCLNWENDLDVLKTSFECYTCLNAISCFLMYAHPIVKPTGI